jgi:hypothetical protein
MCTVKYQCARALPAVQPVAAAIREAALREAADLIDKRHRGDLPDHILSEDGNAIRAMIDNPGKEVMPSEARSNRAAHDTAPAGLSAGGGAGHRSDCAVHNAPAYPAGHCNCGFVATEGGA